MTTICIGLSTLQALAEDKPVTIGGVNLIPADDYPLAATAVPRQTWDVLLAVAEERGHWREPGESEFLFLQRVIRECPTCKERADANEQWAAFAKACGNHPYEDG